MNTISYKEAPIMQNHHGVDARILYKDDKIQVLQITLKPGEYIEKHSMPLNAIFYILGGKGIVEIGNEEQEVSQDILIYSPSELERGWRNTGDIPLRILVTKILN